MPDDQKWRAEEDARTLARAHEIMQDKGRHKRAAAHAKRMYDAARMKPMMGEMMPDSEKNGG